MRRTFSLILMVENAPLIQVKPPKPYKRHAQEPVGHSIVIAAKSSPVGADGLGTRRLFMSTEEQSNAFNEVRAILGKLDRSIDEARSRRLEPDQPTHGAPGSQAPSAPSQSLDREIGVPSAPAAKTELQKKSATFGRAKPLNQSARPTPSQWKSTGSDDDQLIG